MKKFIAKYWGVVLTVVLLSSLLVGATPVSAGNYAFSNDLTMPSIFTGGLLPADATLAAPMAVATYVVADVAQSGSTVYVTAYDSAGGTGRSVLLKSTDGGVNFVPCTATLLPNVAGTDLWTQVAVAPDDPNFVVVVDNIANDAVYVSTNGGGLFSALTVPNTAIAGFAVVNDVAVSPAAPFRYVAIGGANAAAGTTSYAAYWTIGPLAPGWTNISPANPAATGVDNIEAIAFSPSFAADMGLIAITEDDSGNRTVQAEIYSFNLAAWNPVGYNFPRRMALDSAAGAISLDKASLALDANFYLGDESTQIGFIGAGVTDSAAGEVGGIWRFDYAAGATRPLTKIMGTAAAGTAVNTVAWDGTNLMAGMLAAGPVTVQRSANALSVVPSFLANSSLKTPGNGTLPIVYFNNGIAYCASSGINGGIAKSTDNGKSFNGVRLQGTSFAGITDYWVSPDGARAYVLADDGVNNLVLWAKTGAAWQRVAILIGSLTGQAWIVRADKDAPDTVYVARQTGTTIYKSIDAGMTWTTRASSANIQDMVVQDANTLYIAVNASGNVIKSTNAAFTWGFPMATGLGAFGNNCYSMTAIGDDKLIVGGTGGFVAYTADGATWAAIPAAVGAGNTLATASGFATGDTVWAAAVAGGAGSVANWVIGTNTPLTGWTASPFAAPPPVPTSCDGLIYTNGALFVLDSGATLYRYLYPTGAFGVAFGPTDAVAAAGVYVGGAIINSLQATTGSTALWVNLAGATDVLQSYTLYLNGAADAPTPTYPTNNAIIDINSIAGGVNVFQFMFNAPASLFSTPGVFYAYNLQVYLDEAGTIAVAGSAIANSVAASPAPSLAVASNAIAVPIFAGVPGTTYYWRVRVAANTPMQSYWSAMQTFSVQQLQAIVPTLASPGNGTTLAAGTTPAFSWNPISRATSYKFELAADSTFATTLYSTTTSSAGASIPATVKFTAGKNYYWRVKTLTPAEGEWSAVGNFNIAVPVAVVTPVVTPQVTPTLTVVIPAATTTSIVITQEAPPAEQVVNPSYIWAIIIIGAVLVIAVIVLIVRTRRSV